MTKDDLDEIAKRKTHCKPWGEAVTISRAERDQLVALARDGVRYRWLRDDSQDLDLFGTTAPYVIEGQTTEPLEGDALDEAVDLQMAKEEV